MASQNGMGYAQNYDVILKWLAEALRGETLEVLGVPTGRIEEVFGYEPVEIAVTAERVDVMLRDETGAFYHLEEQRNLRRTDLYRFASYHFLAARQWGVQLTDVILASGEVYAGEKVITTQSGTYTPLVIDFTQRDGHRRLREIRDVVQAGTFEQWFELVFLPLYGKETGGARSAFVEEVLRFEADLYKARKLPARLVAATMILSNKLIATERLEALWEEVKMLEILEIARKKGIEEGLQEGKTLGLQEGKTLGLQEGKTLGLQEGKTLGQVDMARDMLMEALIERFGLIPAHLSKQIRPLDDVNVIKGLFHQALTCSSLTAFEMVVKQATAPPSEDIAHDAEP